MERVKTRCCAACRDDCRLPVHPAPSGPAAGNTALGGARVTHFEARKKPLRGAKIWRHPPLRGVENSLRRVKILSRGGAPLGCHPWVDFFRRIFDRKNRMPEFFARRSAFSANRIRCRLFRQKNVIAKFCARRSAFFAQFFARFSSRFSRPVWRPRGRPPRSPPGLGLLPSPEGAVHGPNPSAPGGPS